MLFRTLFLTVSIVGWAAAASFEDANIEEYKNNPERLQAFIDCSLGTEPCNDIDGRIQGRIRNILATKCESCTKKEKSILRDIASLVITTKPEYLPDILAMYDDGGTVAILLDILSNEPSLSKLPAVSGRLLQKVLEYLKHANTFLHSLADSE